MRIEGLKIFNLAPKMMLALYVMPLPQSPKILKKAVTFYKRWVFEAKLFVGSDSSES